MDTTVITSRICTTIRQSSRLVCVTRKRLRACCACRLVLTSVRRLSSGGLSTFERRVAADKDTRPPPLLEHIPLHSPLYWGVQREGRVGPLLSLSFGGLSTFGGLLNFGRVVNFPRTPTILYLGSYGGPKGRGVFLISEVPLYRENLVGLSGNM